MALLHSPPKSISSTQVVSGTSIHRLFPLIARCVTILLGVVLIASAGFHINNSVAFYESVMNYRLVDPWVGTLIAGMLPVFQFLLGTWLILGLHPTMTTAMSAVLFAVFAVAQLSAYLRGLEIGCGCFGPESGLVSVSSISMAALLCFLAVLVFVHFVKPVRQPKGDGNYERQ